MLEPKVCNFIKKETLAQVFFCEFCEFSKNTFSAEHLFCRTPPDNCFYLQHQSRYILTAIVSIQSTIPSSHCSFWYNKSYTWPQPRTHLDIENLIVVLVLFILAFQVPEILDEMTNHQKTVFFSDGCLYARWRHGESYTFALFQCHVERNLEKKWICRYKKLAPTTRKNTVPLKKRDS